MADVNKEIALEVSLKDSTTQGTQTAKQRLRELQKALTEMALAGQDGTEAFKKMEIEAGKLKDQIGDTSQRIKNLASDTKNIDTFVAGIQGIAAGFQIAQGAAALFGNENEDLQKALLKVQGAMALANGVQQVANLLNKDSILITQGQAAAQALYATAIGKSTGALKAFRIALLATGVGAAVVAVGLLVENWEKLTKAVKDFLGIETKDLKAVSDLAQRQVELAEARGESEAKVQKLLMAAYDARIAAAKNEEERSQLAHEKEVARLTYQTKLRTEGNEKQKKDIEDLKAMQKTADQEAENFRLAKIGRIKDELEKEKALRDEKLAILREEKAQREADLRKRFTDSDEFAKAYISLTEEMRFKEQAIAEDSSAKIAEIERKRMQEYVRQIGEAATSVFNFRSSEFDRLSKQASNAAEDEILALDRQLKNKQITQEFYEQQKAAITDKYAKESEKYERKKFENDKVAAIAQALISTYLAGVQVLAQTKGGTIARIIGMTATITAGLAQVATISRQQFRGSTAGKMSATESLAASGGNSPQPAEIFANPQMTMLGTDGAAMGQGQGSSPMRAYVVERDITQTGRRVRRLEEFATLS